MSDRGFSLPEVLVALFVLAIAGVSITQSNSAQVSGLRQAELKTMAMIVAENQMAEVMLQEGEAALTSSGVAVQGSFEFAWSLRRSPPTPQGFSAIEISVREAREEQVLYRLSALKRGNP